MLKKMIAICLAFILVVSMAVMPVFADVNSASITLLDKKEKNDDNDKLEKTLKKFFDSDEFEWAEKAIEKMGAMGILNGVGNGLFKPQNKVTHAEAIAMVIKLVGQQKQAEAIKNQPAYFKGLSDKWSYGYLQLALDLGIIIPQEDGKFNTNSPAKRHDVAKYIIRALGLRDEALKYMNVNLKQYFNDGASVPKNSIGYVFVISQKGIMQGSNNQFKPNEPITRAEMAVLLDKAEGKTDVPIGNTTRSEGSIVSFDPSTLKLKIVVNKQDVTYDVLPSAPVYYNSTYHPVSYLKQGDIVKVILDNQSRVIFIELKQVAQAPSADGKLAIQTVQYENLPQALKDRVDALKNTVNYAAFRYNQSIYLIATMGAKSTGGFGIDIKDVYRETVQANVYNLKAVISTIEPTSSSIVTQAVTFPYEVIKLDHFSGIERVNFVNESNGLLAQASISTIDNVELITGKIYYIMETSRIIYVQESNGSVKAYEIPSNTSITLAGQAATLSSLRKDMPVVISKVNNAIYSVSAQYEAPVVEKVTGKVDTVDVANRVIRVIGSNNRSASYTIPAGIQVTLNNQAAAWTSIIKDMPIEITMTNHVITAVALTDAIANVEGIITAVDSVLKTLTVFENNRATYTYTIPDSTQITLGGSASTLSALVVNMPVVITKTNGVITRVAANNAVETITGVIDSVNAALRIIAVKTNNGSITQYNIPVNIPVTLNSTNVTDFASLLKYMPITITRTNSMISAVAVTNNVETKSGKIYAVNVADRVIRVQENANTINAYPIPVDTPVTVDGAANKNLSDLALNMNIVVTRANGIVTKVEATNSIETITGLLVTTTMNNGKTFISVKVGNVFNQYEITSSTAVFYNNNAIAIQNMPLNTTLVIKVTNGSVSEVRNQ